MTIGRRSTRDIAVAAEAVSLAHIADDREDRKRVEQALQDQRADRLSMHAENKAEHVRTNQRIDTLDRKVDGIDERLAGLPLKIVLLLGGILTLLLTAQQVLWHGWPHR